MAEKLLISEYIGKNAEKILYEKENSVAGVLGALIGPIWFFYRKSYKIGIACLIITFMISLFINFLMISTNTYSEWSKTSEDESAVTLILGLIYNFTANKLYLWDVKRKVKKIIEKNPNASNEELLALVRKAGGVNMRAVGIYLFILFIYIAVSLMPIFLIKDYLTIFR